MKGYLLPRAMTLSLIYFICWEKWENIKEIKIRPPHWPAYSSRKSKNIQKIYLIHSASEVQWICTVLK